MSSTTQSLVPEIPGYRRALAVELLLVLAMCLLLSLGFYEQREWRRFADERHVPLILRGWDGLAWFVWLGAAPVMLALVRRFPLVRGEIARSLGGLVVCSVLLYLAVANLRFGLRVLPNLWLSPANDLPADFPAYLNAMLVLLPMDFLTYRGFLAITFSVDYYFRFRQRTDEAVQLQLKAAQLESELSRAELVALRNQLQPHFLFNGFNAVATLVRQKKNETAVEMIAQFSALLRRALERTGLTVVSLENEMDFVRNYLEIEKLRFGEKLCIEISLDPASLGGLVPNLVLQPLVENAIKHGISQRTMPGVVSIVAERVHDRLAIKIANDGADHRPVQAGQGRDDSPGIGVKNTRQRLEKLYGGDYRFDLEPQTGGGMIVHLSLPWRAGTGQLQGGIS